MKTIQLLIATIFFVIAACTNEQKKSVADEQTKSVSERCTSSYELTGLGGKDTVNLIDCDKRKQGKWVLTKPVIFDKSITPSATKESMKRKLVHITLEEGFYKDDKKVGYWKYYNEEDGVLKDSVLFINGEAVKN